MEEHKQTFSRVKRAQDREKLLRYSIRKYGFGAASVAVAALYLFMGRGAVYAEGPSGANTPGTTEVTATPEGEAEEAEDPEEMAKLDAAFNAGVEAIRAAKAEQLKQFEGLPEENKKLAEAFFESLVEEKIAALSEAYQQGADAEELQKLAATSVQEINGAIDALGSEDPESNEVDQAIAEAKEAIKAAQTEKLLAIRAANHLTEKEQEDLTKTVKELSSQALLGLDKIQGENRTLDTVNKIKTDAVEAIQSVEVPEAPKPVDLSKAKEAAKQELDKELDQYNKDLDQDKVLSDNEKAETKEIAKNYIDQTKDAIEKAQSEAEIEQAKATGLASLDDIYVVGVEKSQEEVHQAAADKKKEIEGNADLSKPEMDTAKKEVETAVEKADKAFEATPAELKSADEEKAAQNAVYAVRDQALKEIEAIKPVGIDKAKEAIKAAQDAKKAAIMAADYLDKAEQEKLTKLADQLAKIGLDGLDQLPSEKKTQDTVAELKEQAVGAIESVEIPAKPMLDRTAALKAIEDAKTAQIEKVTDNEGISEDEAADARADIEEEAGKAVKAVNDATTQDAIDKASQDGVEEIKTINPVGKEFALEEIDSELAAKKAELAKASHLSDEQKKTITDELDQAAKAIKEGIAKLPDYGDTDEEVAGTEKQILDLVNGFKEGLKQAIPEAPKVDRTAALKAIEDAKAEQTEKVNANEGISEAELADALAAIEEEAGKAVKAVNDATTQDAVDKASQDGVAEIKTVNPVGKEFALDEIATELAAKKAEIAKDTKLSDEQKKAITNELEQGATELQEAIGKLPDYGDTDEDVAGTEKQILDLVDGFKSALKQAVPETPKEEQPAPKEEAPKPKEETPEAPKVDRTAALKAIEDAKAEQTEKVNANEGISEAELADALAAIEEEAGKAVKAVNDATTQDAIDKASQDGVAEIKTVNPVGKEFALDEIATELAAKKAEIAKDTKLSDEQKKAITAELEQGASELQEAIGKLPDYGDTDEDVAGTEKQILALVNGFKSALKQVVPETPKEEQPAPKDETPKVDRTAALKAIEDAKMAQEKAAETRKNELSEAELTAAKGEIAKAAETATKAINEAKSQEDVNKASQAGVADIATINPIATDLIYSGMEEAIKDAIAKIDAVKGASQESKDAAKAKLADLLKAQEAALYDENRPAYADTLADVAKEEEKTLKRLTEFTDAVLAIVAEVKPVEVSPAPKEEAPKPKDETPAPKEEAPKPKDETPTPKEEAPKPKDETPAPKEEAPKPKGETPAPKEEAPKPKDETPAPKEEAPEPKDETPAPKEEAPKYKDETSTSTNTNKPAGSTNQAGQTPSQTTPTNTESSRVLEDSATRTRIEGTTASLAGVDRLVVKKVQSAALEGRDYDAFDIELHDANGNLVQPKAPVRVNLQVQNRPVAAVVYLNDQDELLSLPFTQKGDMVSFSASSFSIYAVVYEPQKAAVTETGKPAEVKDMKKEEKKELPNTGDASMPTVTFFVGLVLALMALSTLKRKED